MATKKMAKNKVKGVEVKLLPNEDIIENRIYSNYVDVIRSPYDFTLRFCDATPVRDIKKLKENNNEHQIPIVAEIAIPLEIMPALIKALQSQYKKYKDDIKGINIEKKQKKN